MNRRAFLKAAGLGAAALVAPKGVSASSGSHKKPNIVFILIDDMGWPDVACYGSKFHETPNVDRLARQGMKFSDAYAACPVCSPTRASIMAGQYPARIRSANRLCQGVARAGGSQHDRSAFNRVVVL